MHRCHFMDSSESLKCESDRQLATCNSVKRNNVTPLELKYIHV
jgi:hypothetical protein